MKDSGFSKRQMRQKRALKLIETLESRIDYLMGKIELPDKDSELIN